MAFGCPFEGKTDPGRVKAVVEAYADAGADVVILADTIGTGTPEMVRDACLMASEYFPAERLGTHMHDTCVRRHGAHSVRRGALLPLAHEPLSRRLQLRARAGKRPRGAGARSPTP